MKSRASGSIIVAVFVALVTLLSQPIVAEDGELKGEVKNTQGKAVGEVQVTIVDAQGNTVWEGPANKKGKFTAAVKDAAGDYVTRLVADGYATTEATVQIKGGMTAGVTLTILTKSEMAQNVFNDGVAALQQGQLDKALGIFEKAIELDPTLPNPWQGVAIIQSAQSNWSEAEEAIKKTRELVPGQPLVPPVIVYQTALKVGNSDWQKEALSQLEGTPEAGDAAVFVYNQGVAKVEDDPDAARALFKEALELDPKLAKPYQSLAALSFNEKNYEEAVAPLTRLLEIEPTNRAGLRMAFFSHATLGNSEEASKAFAGWSEEQSNAADEVLQQAEGYFEANDNDNAMALVAPMVKGQPSNGQGHYMLGRILAAKGDKTAAKQELQEFIRLAPDHPEVGTAKAMLEGL